MSCSIEQDRSAFSDPEFNKIRKKKYLSKYGGRSTSMSMSSSLDANEDSGPCNAQRRKSVPSYHQQDDVITCPLEQQHQGKKLLHVSIALPVDFIFSLIFAQDHMMQNVYEARKASDVVNGQWQEDKDSGLLTRQVTYTIAINVANFGNKLSYVTEMQTIQHKVEGSCYILTTEAANNGIPYADSFFMFNHYCLLKEPDGRTKITVWTQVKYKKPVWGVVKGMLEKNAYNGVEAFLSELLAQITLVAERSERKTDHVDYTGHTTRHKRHVRTPSHGHTRQKPRKDIPKESTSNSCNLFVTVSMVLAFLLLIMSNYILYKKLYYLEILTLDHKPDLKPKAGTIDTKMFESKSRFLNHFHEMQEKQMQTWKTAVSDANVLLNQVQESLETVLEKIRENESTMLSALEEFNRREIAGDHENHSQAASLVKEGS